MCKHEYKPLISNEGTTKAEVCIKCGALKVGTITIEANYIQLPLLTADPPGAEGRITYRDDLNKCRYHDGVEWKNLG